MRSASLGSFRKKRKKRGRALKLFLILLTVFSGVLTAFETRYKTLRIAEIEADLRIAPLVAQTVWEGIPGEAEAFWPRLWMSKRVFEAVIEKRHPVKATLRLKSWGRFRLDIEYLNPLFRLYWENKFWYVSADGKMWLESLPDNNFIDSSNVLRKPVLTWGKERTTPLDIANAEGEVHRSSLPVTQIETWYDNVEFLDWTDNAKSLQAGRKEGLQVVQLVFYDGKGGNGVRILFPDDPDTWRESGLAVKKIFPDVTKNSPEIFIDTTYKGKIIVSNRVK